MQYKSKKIRLFKKTVKLIDIATRMDERLQGDDAKETLKVIESYYRFSIKFLR